MRSNRVLLLLLAGLTLAPTPLARAGQPNAPGAPPDVVFVVRHAERADSAPVGEKQPSVSPMMSKADPALSEAGEARAGRLATMLRDARIGRIFTTEYARTRLTAAPLAARIGVPIVAVPAKDLAALMSRLSAPGGPALVVGHSNTVPDILKGLGVHEPVRIADDEYDNLFVVVRQAGGAHLVRLKYE